MQSAIRIENNTAGTGGTASTAARRGAAGIENGKRLVPPGEQKSRCQNNLPGSSSASRENFGENSVLHDAYNSLRNPCHGDTGGSPGHAGTPGEGGTGVIMMLCAGSVSNQYPGEPGMLHFRNRREFCPS